MDALDMMSQLGLDEAVSSMISMTQTAMMMMTFAMIFAGVSVILLYVLECFKWMQIGRKAGLDKDWMAFVPIARTIYRLKITNEEWWKMFFLGGETMIYAGILNTLILAISSGNWGTLATILVCVYMLCVMAYGFYWRYKYCLAFNINSQLALAIWCFPLIVTIVDYLNAFTNLFEYSGKGASKTVGSTASNLVNVPKGNSSNGALAGLSGMYAGQEIPLAPGEELLLGRDNAYCNLIIDQNADKISRRHCSILFDATRGVYMVTDVSSNGTYVDGGSRLVANMATQLQRGTVICLGNRENRFRLN